VCNAPSPAATSAIPIGAYIVSKVKEQIGERAFFAAPKVGPADARAFV
jgi:L-2-hydroxyglutarate oxidase